MAWIRIESFSTRATGNRARETNLAPMMGRTSPTLSLFTRPPAALNRSRAIRRNVPVISISAATTSTVLLTWSPVVALLLRHRGASAADVALTFAAVNLVSAFTQYVGGVVADRYGSRTVIAAIGISVGTVWFATALLASQWLAFAALYVLANGLFGFQGTSFVTIVSDSVPPAERASAFAYYQFWSALSLIAGPLLGTLYVIPRVPAHIFLAATGLVYLAAGIARWRLLVEPRPLSIEGRRASPGIVRALDPRAIWRAAAGTPSRRQLLWLTTGVTLAFSLTVNGPFLALLSHEMDHVPTNLVDLLFAVGPVGALLTGALVRRLQWDTLRLLRLGLIVHAASAVTLFLTLGLSGLVAVFLVLFAGYQAATIAYSSIRVALASDRSTGTILGATSALAGIVAALGVSVAGSLGSRPALALAAGVSLVTVGLVRRTPRDAGDAGPG